MRSAPVVLILVYIIVSAVVVLLLVTRAAGRRDAVRKAELARQAQAKAPDKPDPRAD